LPIVVEANAGGKEIAAIIRKKKYEFWFLHRLSKGVVGTVTMRVEKN